MVPLDVDVDIAVRNACQNAFAQRDRTSLGGVVIGLIVCIQECEGFIPAGGGTSDEIFKERTDWSVPSLRDAPMRVDQDVFGIRHGKLPEIGFVACGMVNVYRPLIKRTVNQEIERPMLPQHQPRKTIFFLATARWLMRSPPNPA
jgi:hypothetical protein